jgi:hypothetical protein
MNGSITSETTMQLVRVLLTVEIVLAVMALSLATIRACGPAIMRRWLSDKINMTAKFMHLYR